MIVAGSGKQWNLVRESENKVRCREKCLRNVVGLQPEHKSRRATLTERK